MVRMALIAASLVAFVSLNPAAEGAAPATPPAAEAPKAPVVAGTVAAIDAAAKTISITVADAKEPKVLALGEVKVDGIKVGDKVEVTCCAAGKSCVAIKAVADK